MISITEIPLNLFRGTRHEAVDSCCKTTYFKFYGSTQVE